MPSGTLIMLRSRVEAVPIRPRPSPLHTEVHTGSGWRESLCRQVPARQDRKGRHGDEPGGQHRR
jgi:hypothetical protein